MSRTKKHKLTGAKSISTQCSNHNSCNYCRDNRTYHSNKLLEASKMDMDKFFQETDFDEAEKKATEKAEAIPDDVEEEYECTSCKI